MNDRWIDRLLIYDSCFSFFDMPSEDSQQCRVLVQTVINFSLQHTALQCHIDVFATLRVKCMSACCHPSTWAVRATAGSFLAHPGTAGVTVQQASDNWKEGAPPPVEGITPPDEPPAAAGSAPNVRADLPLTALQLRFQLPPSAYATMAIRQAISFTVTAPFLGYLRASSKKI